MEVSCPYSARLAATLRKGARCGVEWVVALALIAGCSLNTSGLAGASSDAGTNASLDADGRARADTSVDARARADAGADASADAGADVDSTIGPEPTWTVVETLTVDSASSEPTLSRTVLEAGVVYRLRVSGTITNVIDAFQGDADWYDFSDPKDNGCCEDIGLGIDDFVVDDLDTQPDWGPYDPTHVYEVDWTGDGTTIAALFQDTYYGNNIGSLTLEILAFR